MTRILFLSAETFPLQYQFLVRVFNQGLKEYGVSPVWIMPSLQVNRVERTDWDGSPTWLFPKRAAGSLPTAYARPWQYLTRALRGAFGVCDTFDAVQARDDPLMAVAAWQVSRRRRIPFVYQLSHLKEENLLYARQRVYGSRVTNFVKGSFGLVLRNAMLRRADLVFPISSAVAEALRRGRIRRDRMLTSPEVPGAS